MVRKKEGNQERGSILITFLIITIVFVLILGAGVNLMMGGYKRVSSVAQRNQAHYLAEAGVEKALEDLQSGCRPISTTSATFPSSSPLGTYKYFAVAVDSDSVEGTTVIITSTGQTSGPKPKSVTLTVHVRCSPLSTPTPTPEPTPEPTPTPIPTLPPLDMALFAAGDVSLRGNITINGNVGSNGTIETRGNAKINGGIRENLGYTYPLPSFTPPSNLPSRGSLSVEKKQSVEISGNAYYESIGIGKDATLTVNVGSNTKILWVKSLAVDGKLQVEGTGTLILYVESLAVGNKAEFNTGTGSIPESLALYYASTQPVTIDNQAVIKGLVLVPSEAVITIKGTIIGLLYAPAAQVNLGGNGQTLNGAIIVQALAEDKEAGNQEIVYAPPSSKLQSLLQTFIFPPTFPPTPTPEPTSEPTPTPEPTPTSEPTPTPESTPTPSVQSGPPRSIVGWKES